MRKVRPLVCPLFVLAVVVGLLADRAIAQVQRVTFRDDHTVLVEGKPMFPIGLYYTGEEFGDRSGNLLKSLKDYGFNTVAFYGAESPAWREQLDMAHRLGLKVWVRGINGLAVDSLETEKKLTTQVQQIGQHPALLFWEFQDEPILNKVPVDQARRGQQIVRQFDPNHPLLIVEWPGAADRYSLWNGLGDIYGTDLYPVPRKHGYGGLPNHDITQMKDYIAAIRAARGNTPVMLVLQAWSWNPINYGKSGYPTPGENRFMAYQAVIHGCKAIHYYGQMHCTSPNSASALYSDAKDPATRQAEFAKCLELNRQFWDEQKGFFRELAEAARIFVLRDAKAEQQIAAARERPTIELLTKANGDQIYLLAVNASDKPQKATFHLPSGQGAKTMHVLFENRQMAATAGAFSDDFPAYGTHVYSTSASLPPKQ